jgi:hypothetical protein
LTGLRIGRLLILNQAEDIIRPNGTHSKGWNCICDCGNKTIKEHYSLLSGNTKSCGCLHSELAKERGKLNKKCNKYELSGEYGVGYTSKGEEFYFDLEDFNIINDYYWYKKKDTGYIAAVIDGKQIYQHRFIMRCPPSYEVDHIFHVQYDNRKSNLRVVTHGDNLKNIKSPINNTSGFVGVSYCKSKKKWRAYITNNLRRIHLGYFQNFEDAVNIRKEAEEKYFGEYSYNRSINRNNIKQFNEGGDENIRSRQL